MDISSFNDLMPIVPGWADIGGRIAATLIAAVFLGINRERGGHPAGLRTTILVGLAACLSMIQANFLLTTSQEVGGSMDILRLPLGILTGVGFIGGGAILRRGDVATGVTTAATLWLMTTIGLCFGGGQIIVGTIASAIAFCILSPLKTLGHWLPSEQKGSVGILEPAGTAIPQIGQSLPDDVEACFVAMRNIDADNQEFVFELRWTTAGGKTSAADILVTLRTNHRVRSFEHRTTVT
jgi:putative Mg2+ transporter-C (MgtC) family protein